jgi:hypothetical protein
MPLTKIPDLMRPDVCAARAAVHWQNARAALSLAIQHRDARDRLVASVYVGPGPVPADWAAVLERASREGDAMQQCYIAARQCADLASHYRRRLAVLAGRDAAIGAAVHRDGLVG